jgi:hypothetical protein
LKHGGKEEAEERVRRIAKIVVIAVIARDRKKPVGRELTRIGANQKNKCEETGTVYERTLHGDGRGPSLRSGF